MSVASPDRATPSPSPTEEDEPRRPSVLARVLLALLWVYQRTSVARMPRCRFHPTCSSYAVEAIRVHGAVRGSGHALARVGRCHPWNPGGIDPVRPANSRKSDS